MGTHTDLTSIVEGMISAHCKAAVTDQVTQVPGVSGHLRVRAVDAGSHASLQTVGGDGLMTVSAFRRWAARTGVGGCGRCVSARGE